MATPEQNKKAKSEEILESKMIAIQDMLTTKVIAVMRKFDNQWDVEDGGELKNNATNMRLTTEMTKLINKIIEPHLGVWQNLLDRGKLVGIIDKSLEFIKDDGIVSPAA